MKINTLPDATLDTYSNQDAILARSPANPRGPWILYPFDQGFHRFGQYGLSSDLTIDGGIGPVFWTWTAFDNSNHLAGYSYGGIDYWSGVNSCDLIIEIDVMGFVEGNYEDLNQSFLCTHEIYITDDGGESWSATSGCNPYTHAVTSGTYSVDPYFEFRFKKTFRLLYGSGFTLASSFGASGFQSWLNANATKVTVNVVQIDSGIKTGGA